MATKVEIWNMAIGLFRGKVVANENESSPSADACRVYYNTCLDTLLTAVPWTFATRWTPLPEHLVESFPGGATLALPAQGLKVWGARMPSFPALSDTADGSVRYEVLAGETTGTRVVVTDCKDAEFHVTRRVNEGQLPGIVAEALSLLLASKIVTTLAGAEVGPRLSITFRQQYEEVLTTAISEDSGPRMLQRKESKYITGRR